MWHYPGLDFQTLAHRDAGGWEPSTASEADVWQTLAVLISGYGIRKGFLPQKRAMGGVID